MKNIKILSLVWITLFCASVLAANGSSDYGVNASQLQGVNVSSTHPVADQFLQFNGITQTWMSKTIAGSSGGTVTSIAQTVPSFLSISGSPITTSGALAIGYSGIALPVVNGGTGTTNGSITGTGALLFTAGGSNQSVTVTPSGSGNIILSGNVGVGAGTPSAPLDVNGRIRANNNSGGDYISIYSDSAAHITAETTNNGSLYISGVHVNIRPTADGTTGIQFNPTGASYFLGGNLGVGTDTPASGLDISTTGANSSIIVPRDSTANRPTGVNGMIRYNTDDTAFEGYANGAWSALGGGGGGGANVNLSNLVDPVVINVGSFSFFDTGEISSPVQVEIAATSGNGSQIYVYDSAVDISGGLSGNGTLNLLAESVSIQGQGNGAPILSIDDGGGNLFGLQNSGGANYTVSVPADQGTAGYVLSTDGANPATLTWVPAGGGADQALDNLTSPTAINQDLIFDKGVFANVKTKDETTADSQPIQFKSGDTTGLFNTGDVIISSGTPNTNGQNSGGLYLQTSGVLSGGTRGLIVIQDGSEGVAGNVWTSTDVFGAGHWRPGNTAAHQVLSGTAPSISSCGTSPSVAGNDGVGRITVGSGVITSCTLTFDAAWATAPSCIVQDESASLAIQAVSTTTTIVITALSTFASGSIVYQCVGY